MRCILLHRRDNGRTRAGGAACVGTALPDHGGRDNILFVNLESRTGSGQIDCTAAGGNRNRSGEQTMLLNSLGTSIDSNMKVVKERIDHIECMPKKLNQQKAARLAVRSSKELEVVRKLQTACGI